MKRRDLMKLGAVSPLAVSSLALPARAQVANPAAGHYKFTLGALDITIISDGHMAIPASNLGNNADPAAVAEFFNAYYLDPEINYSHLNHVVIQDGTNTVLVDAGDGGRFMPETSGRMMNGLEAAGIDPYSITHLVLTHAHPDHIWGVRDDFDEPFLPDAAYLMSGVEMDYWMQDGLVDQVGEGGQQFVIGAVNSIETIADIMERVSDGHQVIPGVTMIDTPGHTPGHMSLLVESEGAQMLVIGDAMTHAYMNFAHPEWTQTADMDQDTTIATRARLLDMASADRILVAGYHFPFPGIGYVGKFDGRYEYVPAIWRWDGV